MDDIYGKVEVYPNHFQASKASDDSPQPLTRADYSLRSRSHSWAVRRVMGAASILNFFRMPRFPWTDSAGDDDKIELTRTEVEALRSEIVDADERESHLKAQLEHLDEVLKSARLSGYLCIRTRWTELPGEPPILDDADINDWLPRFVVLNGSCIYYYLKSTDLSPQDSTLLSDIIGIGPLPSFTDDDHQDNHHQRRYAFYILTCHGLRFECSSLSKVQVESWLTVLQTDCKIDQDVALINSIKS